MAKNYFQLDNKNLPIVGDILSSKGAVYNDDGLRIKLSRYWDKNKPIINIVMCYPSTANSINDDITTSRITNILKRQNAGGYNLYNMAEKGWIKNHNLDHRIPLVIAWGSKVRKQNKTKEIRFKLKHFKYLLQFDSPQNYSECMPTRLSVNTNLIRIKY